MGTERLTKRAKRFEVIRKITELERNNCEQCANQKSGDMEICRSCPTFKQLGELGKELSQREPVEEWTPPVYVKPKKKKKLKIETIKKYLSRSKP